MSTILTYGCVQMEVCSFCEEVEDDCKCCLTAKYIGICDDLQCCKDVYAIYKGGINTGYEYCANSEKEALENC